MRPVETGDQPKGIYVKEYGYWRPRLVARIGEYCSYCEVPLGVNLAVEHMLSKTQSINAEDWNNLLLACTNCNSHKLDRTNSEDNLKNYLWPTLDPRTEKEIENNPDPKFNTFDMLTYRKEAKTVVELGNAGVFVWPPSKSRPQKLYPNPDTQTYDQVWVYPSTDASYLPYEEKAKNTILLMGLNDFTPDDNDPKASDRRVFNRTTAWTRAETLATQLANYYSAAPQNALAIELLKEQIKQAAIATGFWSVWMTVFKSHTFVDDNTRNHLLTDLFANSKVFPGTKYTVR